MSNRSDTQDHTLHKIRDIIDQIEEKSAAGDYIYRGEPQDYGKISSNLYRQYVDIIELKLDYGDAYYNRGNAYHVKGNITKAIEDYNEAVELDFNLAEVSVTRGIAWLHLQEWEKAKTDLAAAKGMGVDIIAEFHNTYGYETAADFERDNDVTLPEEISAMLVVFQC